jgi:hypothetical protein
MKFATMTRELHRVLGAALGDRIPRHVPLKELLPIPVVLFPEDEFQALAQGLRAVLSAQQKILRALRKSYTQEELLDRFCVPQRVRPFVDWKLLDAGANIIGRVDIVPTPSGGYRFCELNIGPAIEGPQMHGHCHDFLRAVGVSTREYQGGDSPYVDLGALIRERCRLEGRERIVILDLDSYHTDGPLVYDQLLRYVEAQCAGCEVHLIKMAQYRDEWLRKDEARKTLVYRLFLEDEVNGEWALVERILDSGAYVLNTFENYILGSKAWFPILCDESYRPLLSEAEVAAIETFVPASYDISMANLASVLASKDRLVFKKSDSTEGRGVMLGSERSAAELLGVLDGRLGEWSAQELVPALAPEFPQTRWAEAVAQNAVLGLYHVDGNCSGLLFRCNGNTRVVNLASGGKVAWALRVTDAEYRKLIDRLDGGARSALQQHPAIGW